MSTESRLEKIKAVVTKRQQGVVVIENVVDPHNAAAAVRSCDAFGIQHIYFIFENVPSFNPKKIGKASSSSANKWVDFTIFTSTEECFAQLKREGYTTFVTVLDDQAKSLYDTTFDLEKPAFVFGNERDGVSAKAIELADEKLYIPMDGFVQSLNLSVTVSIFLFELARQRNTGKKFFLTETEQKKLIESFSER